MLTFKSLVEALKARGITRTQGALATGWEGSDEALERYVQLNSHFQATEAARQLAQCLGEVGVPLYGVGSSSR